MTVQESLCIAEYNYEHSDQEFVADMQKRMKLTRPKIAGAGVPR
jgi:hypothetical protein